MIKEVAFTGYPAKDVAALIAFYRDTLGLKLTKSDEGDAPQWAELDVNGGGWLVLMNPEWLEAQPGGGNGLALEVHDIDDAVATLRAKGLTVQDIYDTPVCRISGLRDPEGNRITLHQITAH